MRQSIVVGLALLAAYALGTLQAPARADNMEELSTSALLARLLMTQKEQTETLKALSLGGELARRQREQAEALKTIADQLARGQRDEIEALKAIARATERCAHK